MFAIERAIGRSRHVGERLLDATMRRLRRVTPSPACLSFAGFSNFTPPRWRRVADRKMILPTFSDTSPTNWTMYTLPVARAMRESILVAGGSHASDEIPRATLVEHERILVAVKARDPAAAQEAMRVHLDNAAARAGAYAIGRGASQKLVEHRKRREKAASLAAL